jgi:hypothetical protein
MALEIKFDSEYGEQTQNGVTTLHCVARLMDGEDELDRVLIQGIPLDQEAGEIYRNERADAAFKHIESAADVEAKPAKPDTTKWAATIAKTATI